MWPGEGLPGHEAPPSSLAPVLCFASCSWQVLCLVPSRLCGEGVGGGLSGPVGCVLDFRATGVHFRPCGPCRACEALSCPVLGSGFDGLPAWEYNLLVVVFPGDTNCCWFTCFSGRILISFCFLEALPVKSARKTKSKVQRPSGFIVKGRKSPSPVRRGGMR